MNNTVKRILSLALALMTVVGCFVSCADSGGETPTSADTAAESEAATYDRAHTPDNLPADLDFKKAAMRVAYGSGTSLIQEVNPAEDDNDPVSESVYERNVIVADRLNIEFEFNELGDSEGLPSALNRSITSGSDDYDIVFCYQWKLLPQTLKNMYLDLWDNEYIDTTQPWWWADYINELRIGDSTFYALNGDISLSSLKYISAMFFNKDKIKKYSIDPESVYELVLNGDWTYEVFYGWLEMAYIDANGDGKRDVDDEYGAFLRPSTEPDHFTYTAGNRMNERDEDGHPVLTIDTEYFANFMEYLVNMYYQNPGIYVDSDYTLPRDQLFSDGKALFHATQLGSADNLREMRDAYGIIPYPKWNKEQAGYGALVHDAAALIAIPTTTKQSDAASATIEAMCAQSYRTVIPAYYEVALKLKYVSDATTGIIIDMIRGAARTDFVYAYNYALNGAGLLCRNMVIGKNTNLASEYKKIKRSAEKQLQNIIKAFEKEEQ